MRVLVTGIGGPAGAALAGQLAWRGLWVGGVDARPLPAPPGDAFARVSLATDAQAYLDDLAAAVRTWQIDAIIPTVSEELVLLAAHAHDLPAPTLIGPAAAVAAADDKYETALRLARAGVPAPRFALPHDLPTACEAVAAMGGTIVVKPRVSRGGRGVHVITAADAASDPVRRWWRQLGDELIVQRFAPGREFAPVVFKPPNPAAATTSVVLEKQGLRDGIVGNAVSVMRTPPDDAVGQSVGCVARAAASALELSGPADIDIRLTDEGLPVVLEVNARFGANSAAAPELLTAALDALSHARARWEVRMR